MLFVACGCGAAAGAAFAWLWLLVVPHAAHRQFWGAMAPLARDVLQADEFLRLVSVYRRLAELVCRYVARNFGGMLLAGLPAAALLLFLEVDEVLFIAAFALATFAGLAWPRRS